MMRGFAVLIASVAALTLFAEQVRAEILALVNYETNASQTTRREGIAIVDVDPASANFGKIVEDIALPADFVNHHIFYNHDMSKAYITAFGQQALYVMDMSESPLKPRVIEAPDCAMGEDIVFSEDGKRWFLTCMASDAVIVGDAVADRSIKTIKTPMPYPHGIAIHAGIDRILITNTIKGDLTDPGEMITVIEASTGKTLASHKVSMKPSPSGEAPVEVIFVPGSNPPVAYVTNMFGATLWAAVWDSGKKDFDVSQIYDFAAIKAGVPLEMYFNEDATRLYLTTGVPGALHIFDIDGHPTRPRLLKTLPTAGGAHHVAITKDKRLAFVQNNLLGLEGMNDGSITVIDFKNLKVIGSIDTFKEQGLLPNLIVLMPKWNYAGGH